MKAELLTIGNEILIGQITNTNAVWMAQQLNQIGVSVVHMSSVADDKDSILKAFADAQKDETTPPPLPTNTTSARKCEECGKDFTGSSRAKYCGATCKQRAKRRRAKAT